jgi:hypothetical protein
MAEILGTIISSAGQALIELLKANVGFADGDIVMKSPAEAETTAKVSMYLFQLQTNPDLLNRPHVEVGLDGLRPAPIPLDLYYLITPLSTEPVTALGHLESIMQAFGDSPVLTPPLLPPTMVATGNEEIRLTPRNLSLEDTNRLWAMFPNKQHSLSATYLLSPVQIPSARVDAITRVVEKTTEYYRTGEST